MIDELLRRFESQWRRGTRPHIEDFLSQVDSASRSEAVARLIALEVELRAGQGNAPRMEEYVDRFPGDRRIVEQVFAAATVELSRDRTDSIPVADNNVSHESQWEATRPRLERGARNDVSGSKNLPDPAAYPPPPQKVGPEIPGFEIVRRIAAGGMGVVYLARQPKLGRLVALKTIRTSGTAEREQVERFLTEAQSAGRLSHPNIVSVYDVGVHEGQYYYSMAYVDGPSLGNVLRDGPIEGREAAALMRSVARAIGYAHRKGIIHRDLKPANILLAPAIESGDIGDRSGIRSDSGAASRVGSAGGKLEHSEPRITDFGLAKRSDADSNLTQTGQILGTPSYMAPEQALGSPDVGPAADIYSLGAVLYACLTGRPPFQAARIVDTLRLVTESEPVAPRQLEPNVDRDLETICLKCLRKDPARRYESADDMAADLDRYLRDEPIMARPISAWERSWRWARRRPAVIALLSLMAVLSVVGPWTAVVQARLRRSAETNRRAAEASAQKAHREARRAEQNRKLAEQNYVDALKKSITIAANSGNWAVVLERVDEAIRRIPEEALRFRLMKLVALDGLSQIKRARKEARSLWEIPDKGDYAGEIALWWADVGVLQRSREESRQLFQRAIDLGLPPAEEAYAHGMLADTTPQAVAHYRRAIELDPFHHRAHASLVLYLLLLGRRDEARFANAEARRLFDHDVRFDMLQLLIETLSGNSEGTEQVAERLRGRVPEEQRQFLLEVLSFVIRVIDIGDRWDQGQLPLKDPRMPLKFAGLVLKAKGLLSASPEDSPDSPFSFRGGTTAISAYMALFQEVFAPRAMLRRITGRSTDLKKFKQAVRRHPDGLLFFLYAMWCFAENRNDEAVEAFAAAASHPHSYGRGQREALFGLAAAHVARGASDEKVDLNTAAELALEPLRQYVRSGPVPDHRAGFLINIALRGGDFRLADEIAAMKHLEHPESPQWLLELAKIAEAQKHHMAVIDYCERALKIDPDHERARQLKEKTVQALTRQLDSWKSADSHR